MDQKRQKLPKSRCIFIWPFSTIKLGKNRFFGQKCRRGNGQKPYIYIYIYAVKLLTGPRLAILIVTNWATLIVTNWATSFSHYKNRGFRWFFGCSVIIVFFCFRLFFSYLKIAFFKKGVQKLVFSIFSVLSYFFENSLFWFVKTL